MNAVKMIATLALTTGLLVSAPYHSTAGEQQEGQPAQTGDTEQPAAPSADVQERGLNLAPGQVPAPVLQTAPAPFKCSAATLKCRCYGASDCNWMRRVMGDYCIPPDGCTQNCECRITK